MLSYVCVSSPYFVWIYDWALDLNLLGLLSFKVDFFDALYMHNVFSSCFLVFFCEGA